MNSRTLLLNSWYLPTKIIPWESACRMKYLGKIDVVAEYDEEVRSPSVVWKMPAVVRLRMEVRVHKRGMKFSREGIYSRDKFHCQYCGKKFVTKDLTLDHVVPKSHGGRRDWKNIVTACGPCNRKKADRTSDQSGMFPIKDPVKPKHLPLAGPRLGEEDVPSIWIETLNSLGIAYA